MEEINLDDLIFLSGPITEDAIIKTLETRFNGRKFYVSANQHFFSLIKVLKSIFIFIF